MEKKVEKKCMIIIIIILSIGLSVLFAYKLTKTRETRKNKDVRQCVEKKLEIKLGKGVTLVEGEAYDEYGEEYVDAKFKVKKAELENLRETLKSCLWKYEIKDLEKEETQMISRIKETKMDLSDKTIVDYYEQSREGEKAKTIWIEAFIVTDSEGEYYFYIFY